MNPDPFMNAKSDLCRNTILALKPNPYSGNCYREKIYRFRCNPNHECKYDNQELALESGSLEFDSHFTPNATLH